MAALVTAIAACSGTPVSGSDQPGVQGPTSVAPGPAGATDRISVAASSQPDIAAALNANGVGDAEKWAEIVKKSGPYPAGDAGQTKIRQVLTRFGADAQEIGAITNVLTP